MDSSLNGVSLLLKAAEFVDRRARESEHGYATTLPTVAHSVSNSHVRRRKLNKFTKADLTRSTHNELEKNRRAHLRYCLEHLKEKVPLNGDSSRHTTLGLLTATKRLIKSMEEQASHQQGVRNQLERERVELYRRLEQLTSGGEYRSRGAHSISECSSISSTSSGSSEPDDVDIMRYGDGSSDVEDDDVATLCHAASYVL